MTLKNLMVNISIAGALALTGCTSSSNDSGKTANNNNGSQPPSGTATTIRGSVVAGNVNGATVGLYTVCGTKAIASTKTDANGDFVFEDVELDEDTVYRVVASGGSYISEASLKPMANGRLKSILMPRTSKRVVVTPLTSMLTSRLDAIAGTCRDIEKKKIDEAAGFVADIYGLDDPEKLLTEKPDLTDTADVLKFKYGFILGVLEELALHLDIEPKALYEGLAEDIADGKFDGRRGEDKIELGGGKALPPTAGVADTIAATFKFAKSDESALTDLDIDESLIRKLSETLVEEIASAPVSDSSSGLDITNSGAITSVSSRGKQILFVAARSKGLVGIDITNPEGELTEMNLDSLNAQLADIGLANVGGVIAVPGTEQALVYSYGSTTVALVDVSEEGNERVINHTTLDISSRQRFSGGDAYISSGLPQVSVNGIWLATADGYKLLDVSTLSVTREIPLANNQIIAENIGGTTTTSKPLLFSPNYGTDMWGGNGGLQIVDLIRNEAYSMDDINYSSTIGIYPGMGTADAGSVDSGYKVGIITPEDQSTVALVKLDELSFHDNNVSDKTDNTFTLNSETAVVGVNLAPDSSLKISGVYTDSSSHLALFMAGYYGDIAVARLQDPSEENWTGLSEWNYARNQYSYSYDPHAGAVIKSLSTGKTFGYLLDGSGNVIQVDMEAFLDANATNHQVSVDLYDTGVLKKIGDNEEPDSYEGY